MKKYHLFLFLFAFAIGFVGCSKDDDSEVSQGTTHVAVKLTDAPGDYEKVVVDVEDVMIKRTTGDGEEEGWVSLGDINGGPVDLLELTGGVTKLLAEAEIEAGFVSQIRLVLGDNNYLVREGSTDQLVLNVPSGQQSGLKLQINEELEADASYTFILDFDVDKSVVTTGNGGYNLNPVIRMSVEENSGTIQGTVTGVEDAIVTAKSAKAEVSANLNADGKFVLHGLPAGTYLVTVTPEEGLGLEVAQINNVVVEQGAIVTLDPIFFETD